MARKRTPFAAGPDDILYVESRASGISFLVSLIDGMTQTIFDGDTNNTYFKVADVVAWHEKELADSKGKSGNSRILAALKVANEKFAAGKVHVNER
jgi:hypothetical protein